MPTHETRPNTPEQGVKSDRNTHSPQDHDEKAQPEAENAQRDHNRKPIEQARKDVEAGIQDTERIGTPNDVPASGDQR